MTTQPGRPRGDTGPSTLVVVPAYNEETALPGTLAELRARHPELDVVVVDDGSRDGTARVAAEAGVLVLRLPFNLGVGGAVRAGLRFAAERGYDRAVILDADGQHDPAAVKALLDAVDEGADLVIGSRFADPASTYVTGRTRRRAMGLLSWIVRLSTGKHFTDTTSGFRAVSRPVMELLARDYPVEYLADTVEVLLMVDKAGYQVVEVPVAMRPRAGGQPSAIRFTLLFNYLRLLVGILASVSRRRPLRTGAPAPSGGRRRRPPHRSIDPEANP